MSSSPPWLSRSIVQGSFRIFLASLGHLIIQFLVNLELDRYSSCSYLMFSGSLRSLLVNCIFNLATDIQEFGGLIWSMSILLEHVGIRIVRSFESLRFGIS